MENPKLYSASFEFAQESNCVTGGDDESLIVRCESSLGIDNDNGCFYIIKTGETGWAMDEPSDMGQILQRCKDMLSISPKSNKNGEKGK